MIKNLVSIIIPCYNSEKYVAECLDAILIQTYKNIEVIIVDDGSTDKTREILNSYIDKFKQLNIEFRIIIQKNEGQASAVNNALKYVRGEFLTWQDSDDLYTENAIELMVNYLKAHNDMQFVRGEVEKMNEEMTKVLEYGKSRYQDETNIFNFYLLETDSYCFPGIFMVKMLYFDECIKNREIVLSRLGQNWQLILPIAYKGRCGYIDKVVYKYRIRDDSHWHSITEIKELLERSYRYEELLISIIEKIDMPSYEIEFYKKLVKSKYIKYRKEIYFLNFEKIDNIKTKFKNYFDDNQISNLIIYGMGKNGKKLLDILLSININVDYAIDKNARNLNIEEIKVLTIENSNEKADAVIVTPSDSIEEMKENLSRRNLGRCIILKELINDFIMCERN